MRSNRTFILTAALAAAVLLAASPVIVADTHALTEAVGTGDADTPAFGTGVGRDAPLARRITDPADFLGGYAAEGELDDFLLANGDVAIIIEDIDHLHDAGLSGGNIVDAAVPPYWADELASHFTLLEEYPRQALYDTVYIESDGNGGEAVIVARGVDSDNPDLEVTTRYRVTAGVRYIKIETTIFNHGGSVSGYSAGDALNWWGGGTHFAPGYGFDITGTTTYSAWIGATGASTCYGYTIDSGTLTCTHGDLWSDPIVFSGNISAGASQTFTRYFVAGNLGLASVSDAAHEIRGTSVGTVAGTITDEDTGEPIPNATVSCDVGGTSTYTQARSDMDGNYSATLYAGSYTFKASVPSYLPTQEDASITVSQTTTVDFELESGEWTPANTDTLTVVMRPILSVPTLLTPGDAFTIDAMAPQATTGWAALLRRGSIEIPLSVTGAEFEPDRQRWFITATVPGSTQPELYDLVVSASDSIHDVARHAVSVKKEDPDDFYFIHITDPHMPTHLYYYQDGAESDSTEMDDMRAVIDDINLLLTGDVVNEGELEEYLNWRSFTKAKRIMRELDVPVYITGGNHDLGGWESTPPPDGTARRTWWRFFGWRWLNNPPPGEVIYTQNYSFDYGGAHFIGLEAYDNYDNWRYWFYGRESFTGRQMAWLVDDVATVDPPTPVIAFHHYDFGNELMLDYYGIDAAFWGHIHRNWGDITTTPFNLATDNVCDGARSMRLVRVSDGVVAPCETFRSGSTGQNLRIAFDRPNNGTESTVTAIVTNGLSESFENGLVKFHVRADSIPYGIDNGELLQTMVDGDVATCYVKLEMESGVVTTTTLSPTTGVPDGIIALLKQNRPNPARTGTTIHFVLTSAMEVMLEVFDVAGRRVASLEGGLMTPGPHESPWDLTDDAGNTVASGVYFYRLKAGGETLTRKLIVVR
jgi:hypothetical protein